MCFPVNFTNFLRTPILQNICERPHQSYFFPESTKNTLKITEKEVLRSIKLKQKFTLPCQRLIVQSQQWKH